jgi:hypothetical protein
VWSEEGFCVRFFEAIFQLIQAIIRAFLGLFGGGGGPLTITV